MKTRIIIGLFALLLAGTAIGQHAGHSSHAGHGATSAGDSAATRAYRQANAKMHKEMDIKFSGDADVDFVKGMIPHHQGAVDMAKIVLQHGKDPAIRKLAEEIIAAQDKELSLMRDWLKKRGH